MKEMYDWVAWHRELARKIAEGGRDDLVEKIEQVADKVPEQAFGPVELGRDPLSFFGFLRDSQSKSNEVCEAVQDVFGLETELPDPEKLGELWDIIFPSASESLSREGAMFPVGNGDLLWRLFEQARQATKDNPDIKQEDWKIAMDIDGVEVGTLTQALFLVNPDCFLPVDSAVDACFQEGWRDKREEEIKGNEGYEKYLATRVEIENRFPRCEPYEIYTFLRWQEDKEAVNEASKFFQVSTNAHGDGGADFWDKDDSSDKYIKDNNFKEYNWVFVGGAASGISWKKEDEESLSPDDVENAIEEKRIKEGKSRRGSPYPLCDDPKRRHKVPPKRGDIVLVRTGVKKGRAIGVVLKNDYNKPDGLKRKSKIHVLWINKSNSSLGGSTDRDGFNSAKQKDGTYRLFANAEAYKSSLELINQLRGKTIGSGKQVNQDRQQARASTVKHHLNTILYGPPGTGKTYDTVNYAVAIVEGKPVEDIKKERGEEDKEEGKEKGYKGVKERFDECRDNGQIGMVTFHQNYAYEDFIEGIRPVLDEDGEGDVKYELRKGVFKEISDRATEDNLLRTFALSIQKELEKGGEIRLSDDGGINDTIKAVDRGKNGFSFKLGGPGEGKSLSMQSVKERRYYHEFLQGKIKGPSDIKNVEESQSPQLGTAPQYFALLKKIKEFHDDWKPEPLPREEIKNYVLIIDEINRGNIAKIFGELITLIEDSRRLGRAEATKVTLPYSGKSFGVPDNLYIIGTMNTADRSIALLDTALRRRFEFKEMMPDPSQIEKDIDEVNLKELLKKMNERIRVLLDREHQIGHTYFLGVKDMDALKQAFQNKIIPLLQEYFYDNWQNIDLVLNQNGFIVDKSIDSGLFKKSDLIDEQRKIYEILSEDDKDNGKKWDDPKSYQDIYMKSDSAQNTGQNKTGNGG